MLTARQGRAIHGCGKQRERQARTCRRKSFIPRPYVFALDLDCNGRVESPSSAAPAIFPCQVGQPVEVTERLVWNRVLVAGSYVINNPQPPDNAPVSGHLVSELVDRVKHLARRDGTLLVSASPPMVRSPRSS